MLSERCNFVHFTSGECFTQTFHLAGFCQNRRWFCILKVMLENIFGECFTQTFQTFAGSQNRRAWDLPELLSYPRQRENIGRFIMMRMMRRWIMRMTVMLRMMMRRRIIRRWFISSETVVLTSCWQKCAVLNTVVWQFEKEIKVDFQQCRFCCLEFTGLKQLLANVDHQDFWGSYSSYCQIHHISNMYHQILSSGIIRFIFIILANIISYIIKYYHQDFLAASSSITLPIIIWWLIDGAFDDKK